LAARHEVGHLVHVTGPIVGRHKAGALVDATALVVPSRSEAMSVVALEAGAVGTPVLITDACGFDEIAEVDGGFVVPATVEGLEGGLRGLFAPGTQLPQLGDNLRRLVVEKYAWSRAADSYLELFGRLRAPDRS